MELGRHPLAVHYHSTCLNYRSQLLKMSNTRYQKAFYLMLKNLDDRSRFLSQIFVKQIWI